MVGVDARWCQGVSLPICIDLFPSKRPCNHISNCLSFIEERTRRSETQSAYRPHQRYESRTMDAGSQGKALLSVGVDAILSHQPQPLNKTKVRINGRNIK